MKQKLKWNKNSKIITIVIFLYFLSLPLLEKKSKGGILFYFYVISNKIQQILRFILILYTLSSNLLSGHLALLLEKSNWVYSSTFSAKLLSGPSFFPEKYDSHVFLVVRNCLYFYDVFLCLNPKIYVVFMLIKYVIKMRRLKFSKWNEFIGKL